MSSKTFENYKLVDTVANINGASIDTVTSRASTVVINEDRTTENTGLKLGDATTLANTTSVKYTGTDKANIVELSHALSANNTVTRSLDFKDDAKADQLVLNVDETNTKFASFNSDGTVKNGISNYTFNIVNNFDLTGAEDKFGVSIAVARILVSH